jgi:hypothetical protein
MVPDGPFESSADTDFASSIRHLFTLSRIVPHASEASNHKLLNANNECDDPEKAENIEPEHVFSLLFPLDGSDKRILLERWLSNTVQVGGAGGPDNKYWEANDISNYWKGYHSQVLGNKLRSSLHNRCTKSNVFPAAANTDHVNKSKSPSNYGTCKCELIVI